MKVAVSATAPSLEADIDPRFGRARYILIVDTDTMEFEALENPNVMAPGGAGIATAQMVAQRGVQAVIGGNMGPNAAQALMAAGIQLFPGVTGKVRDAVQAFKEGRLQSASGPTVGPHFGMGRGWGGSPWSGPAWAPPPQPAYPGPPPALHQELEFIRSQVGFLRDRVEELLRRIEELGRMLGE